MVDAAGQVVVAILTRAPSAGGKSRLFGALGRAPDPALIAALFLDTLDAVRVPGVATIACYAPETAGDELRALVPPDVGVMPQRGNDLGARMRAAFDDAFGAGARAVVLVGSDLPLLDPAVVSDAAAALRARPDRVVLGPARDGGYYLIGATRTPTPLLHDIPWGTASVLADTVRRADAHRIDLHLLAEGEDVDTPDDLARVASGRPERGRRTRAWAAAQR